MIGLKTKRLFFKDPIGSMCFPTLGAGFMYLLLDVISSTDFLQAFSLAKSSRVRALGAMARIKKSDSSAVSITRGSSN